MRLIDADKLSFHCNYERDCSADISHCQERCSNYVLDYSDIKAQPTAYDIDKVVEELEKLADESYKAYCIAFNSDDRAEYDAYTNAIEIVKQGGVSDDVCEWTSTQINNEWKPSCEPNSTYNVFGVAWFRRCPYCGKKIKVGD